MPRIGFIMLLVVLMMQGETVLGQTTMRAQDSFAVSVQKAMGLRPGKEDILAPLADTFAKYKAAGGNGGEAGYLAMDKLVAVLNGEADLDALEQKVLENVKISQGAGRFGPPPDWKYGSYSDMAALGSRIFDRGKSLRESDSRKSVEYVRAGALLEALTYYEYYTGGIRRLADDKAFASLAKLDDAQVKAVREVIAAFDKQEATYFDKRYVVLTTQEELINSDSSEVMPVDEVDKALAGLDGLWAVVSIKNRADVQMTIFLAWEDLNLAYLRDDQGAVAKFETLIKKWRNGAGDDIFRKWLDEALKVRGPLPVTHIAHE
jgi:hypothetical protein